MRVDEMITAVREQALEFDSDPISDEGILRRLNFAYSYAYNHFVKSNDSLFAKYYYFSLQAGLSQYDLPKSLFGKRIESFECPTPPQSGYQPFAYAPIDRIDPQSFTRYDAPRGRTLLPSAWTQMRNKLWVAPPPLIASKVRMLATPSLVPLGLLEGSVVGFQGDTISLDKAPTATLSTNLAAVASNIISISDGTTGEVKAVYVYEGINGTDIQLGSASVRTEIKGQPVRKCYSHAAYKLTYDAANKTITVDTTTPILEVAVGDYIEVQMNANPGGLYNIEDDLEDDTDPYDQPEYEMPAASIVSGGKTVMTFTRGGKVVAVSDYSITWSDTNASPTFIDGFVAEATVFSGDLTLVETVLYNNLSVVRAVSAVNHGLTIGKQYKMTMLDTGVATLDGKQKIVPDTAYSFVVLMVPPVLTGFNASTATWSLYKYGSSYVTTGWPALKDVSPSSPPIATLSLSVLSPYVYTLKPYRTDNDPDVYEHSDDIAIDDNVCWGWATGVPIIPEAYHEALVQYAVLTLKSSLNETDNEVAALLKELFVTMKGDTAGRRLGTRIERKFGGRSNNLSQSRRFGRR